MSVSQLTTQETNKGELADIHFTKADVSNNIKTGSEPVIIRATIVDTLVYRVYVDTGSSVEIMFEHCYKKLKQEGHEWVVNPSTQLASFDGHPVWPV